MKIIALSDTHGRHNYLDPLPSNDIDVIIHAGDCTNFGLKEEVLKFLEWYEKINIPIKILIPGNHDFYFEDETTNADILCNQKNIKLLITQSTIVHGFNIWGSPITPYFNDWAFGRERGETIKNEWDKIPKDTDILVTHGPAYGILDKGGIYNSSLGCEELRKRIFEIKPMVHIFGHIHESYGTHTEKQIKFFNVSICNKNLKIVNPIRVITV